MLKDEWESTSVEGKRGFSVRRKAGAQWVQYIMMVVQGNSQWRWQSGGPQLNSVFKGNLLGPRYVKKIR